MFINDISLFNHPSFVNGCQPMLYWSGFMWFGFSGFADEGDDKAMSNDLRTYPPWESNIAMETSILDKLNCSKRLCMESFRCQAG